MIIEVGPSAVGVIALVLRWVVRAGKTSASKANAARSVEDLQEKLSNFIDFFNDTMAKPFRWTYTGSPLAA